MLHFNVTSGRAAKFRAGNDEEETDLGDGVTSVEFTAVHPPPASAQELNRVLKEAASRCATTLDVRCPLVTNELQEAAIGTGSSASRQASFNADYHAGLTLHSLDQVASEMVRLIDMHCLIGTCCRSLVAHEAHRLTSCWLHSTLVIKPG